MIVTSPESSHAGPQFPDDSPPEGSVVDGAFARSHHEESFDFVVVGSGAAGAVAAETLTRAGLLVAIVEEGPWIKTRDFGDDVSAAFRAMMRDAGTQAIEGRSFLPMLQGRCVGGSTVVNSAIAWRTPEDVLDDWRARFGLPFTMADLEPHFAALERDLEVRRVDEAVLGDNNRAFLRQAEARGLSARVMQRYDGGCRGSGRCLTGCPHAAKRGMSVSYVPWALSRGARLFTSTRAERVEIKAGRAEAVVARAAGGGAVVLHARHGVVVAASTVQTPNVLRRSGVRARALGRHFQAHPGLAIAGYFRAPIDMGFGATQGAESVHFRSTQRFKLETISMPPELAVARIPGAGAELIERLADYRHVGIWAAQVRAEAEGTVGPAWGGGDRVRLSLTERDLRATREACVTLAGLMFDAGAREVWPGIHGVPSVLRARDEVEAIARGPLDSRAYSFIATHLFGAARMGPDPRAAVVDTDFQVHGARALYVVDSSVFPTNLGVNPQHSIMAMSRLAATRAAERALGSRAPRRAGAA